MPPERIVGGVAITLFFLGIACVIRSGGGRTGPPKRPKWRAAGYWLSGCAFLQFGLSTLLFVAISPRPEVTGTIADLNFQYGKSVSTSFRIAGAASPTPRLRIEGQTPKSIAENERATVRYVEYDRHVTDLTILSGDTSGWTFHDTDGPYLSLFLCVLGAAYLYGARQIQASYPRV